jgi:hypothetical protein
MIRNKRIKVIYKKLGRSRTWGLSHNEGVVEIDERAKGKKHLEVLVHECLHELFPDMKEAEIESKAAILTRTLWHEKYRRIDDHDKEPLQDGEK